MEHQISILVEFQKILIQVSIDLLVDAQRFEHLTEGVRHPRRTTAWHVEIPFSQVISDQALKVKECIEEFARRADTYDRPSLMLNCLLSGPLILSWVNDRHDKVQASSDCGEVDRGYDEQYQS